MKKSHTIQSLLEDVSNARVICPNPGALSDVVVSEITSDSREVVKDSMFVALEGAGVDGHHFIAGAIAGGAVAVAGQSGRLEEIAPKYPGVVFIEVDNSYEAYAAVAANYFCHPAKELTMAAVTGTNGKTTVTYIVEDMLKAAGRSVGVIGTVNNRYTIKGEHTTYLPTLFTTPEAYSLQSVLRTMADAGVEIVVMEVSSHALAQARVGTLAFQVAAFTNLSRDHLDYHQSMADYFSAKKTLFKNHLAPHGTAVLPKAGTAATEKEIKELKNYCSQKDCSVVTWGRDMGSAVCLVSYDSRLENSSIEVDFFGEPLAIQSLLVGDYNMDNLLTAMALASALGVEKDCIIQGAQVTTGAPGRLQRITAQGWGEYGPTVFVDYAHTPDALEKVLQTAKELPHRELYGIFGCGGDRDPGKRVLMGRIGARLCDVSIVTDDNPRTEDPDRIVAQVIEGVVDTGVARRETEWLKDRVSGDKGSVVIRERAQAIEQAIRYGQKGDIVVIAGKGHEPYQLTLEGKRYFDDREQARENLWGWTVELLAEATKGTVIGGKNPTQLLAEVTTDSRLKTEGAIFVALKGENHDAHDFAAQAAANGAACLIVDREIEGVAKEVCQIKVKDTLCALGDMAAYRRRKLKSAFEQKVIGLTGSCGKTTVKEMIAAILKRKFPAGEHYPENAVHSTKGNFNNLIGLPLTVLPLGVQQKIAVLEMGMNVPGEIERLAEIADPDICLITNIHGAHLQGLHSIEGVADAKEELFKASGKESVFVVNLDDERVKQRAEKYQQARISYGVSCLKHGVNPDVFATDVKILEGGAVTFTMHYQKETQDIHLFIVGEHNVSNALAAAAATLVAGCTMEQIAHGLADFRAPDKRMEMFQARAGFSIINDTYNANPASMEAGLRTLAAIGKAKKLAVIGDMLELGDEAVNAHYEIGRIAASLKLNGVITYGEWSADIARGMIENGAGESDVIVVQTKDQIENYIRKQIDAGDLAEGDLVLFKASRGLCFETIVECFR